MLFCSTRGQSPEATIREVALTGMAPDGGLYLPKAWPHFPPTQIKAMRGASYAEIAFQVLTPFFSPDVSPTVLEGLIFKSYGSFGLSDVVALKPVGDKLSILELFHGPTLAFKDIALQFLGHLFEYLLIGTARRLTVIGATSGDTGSAAIAALAGRKNIDLFILYPSNGPSDIQRKQMTCVDDANVHAIAIDGSFDDCQAIVKAIFANGDARKMFSFSTVNSINLVRILVQTVYYFVAASRCEGAPSFVVPTGNFGDIFAGYAARKCGLPINKLVIASNSNDSLTRFFESGRMAPMPMCATLSPSMDIQISSNFERLIYDLCDGQGAEVRALMLELKEHGGFRLSSDRLDRAKELFVAGRANDEQTLATMTSMFEKHGYLVDPHSAVGLTVAGALADRLPHPVISLATAHPAKFPETVFKATGLSVDLPPVTAELLMKAERRFSLAADEKAVFEFITANTSHE